MFKFLATSFICILATIFSSFIYSPINRPLWFDEFLQYAFGSAGDLQEAWTLITVTNTDINHGQTGFLSLIHYLVIKYFGASYFSLRLPSIVASVLMFLGVMLSMRYAGLGLLWGVVAVLAVITQSELMHYISEARPYIFLCAGVSLTLAYYLAGQVTRNSLLVKLIGYAGVGIGCLFHPYFSLYWVGIVCATMPIKFYKKVGSIDSLKTIIIHANIFLVIFGICLYFGIGSVTWIGINPALNFDSMQWMDKGVNYAIKLTHLEFLYMHTPFGWLLLLYFLAIFLAPRFGLKTFPRDYNNNHCQGILAGFMLILISIFITSVLVYTSIKSEYWVLPRQWVASIFLLPVASIIFTGSILQSLISRKNMALMRLGIPYSIAFLYLIILVPRLYEIKPQPPKNFNNENIILGENFPKAVVPWVRMADANYPIEKRKEIEAYALLFVNNANIRIVGGLGIGPEVKYFYCSADSVRSNRELMTYYCPK